MPKCFKHKELEKNEAFNLCFLAFEPILNKKTNVSFMRLESLPLVTEYTLFTLSKLEYIKQEMPLVFKYAREQVDRYFLPDEPKQEHPEIKEQKVDLTLYCKHVLKKMQILDEEGKFYMPALRLLSTPIPEKWRKKTQLISLHDLYIPRYQIRRITKRIKELETTQPALFQELQTAIRKNKKVEHAEELAYFLNRQQKVSKTVRAVFAKYIRIQRKLEKT